MVKGSNTEIVEFPATGLQIGPDVVGPSSYTVQENDAVNYFATVKNISPIELDIQLRVVDEANATIIDKKEWPIPPGETRSLLSGRFVMDFPPGDREISFASFVFNPATNRFEWDARYGCE